jgi:hypothetical protein
MVRGKTLVVHPWEVLPSEELRIVAFLEVGNLELLVEVHNLEVRCTLEEAFLLEVLHNLEVAFHLEGLHREDILTYYESNNFY